LLVIVQEIGAVAGCAAVVGLAVLSALHLSQARDVKRLREWAGRAQAVSRTVGISQDEPATADRRALAGDATVSVIAGADKAP
jgi:DNA gyrase inhibitor GyrI